MRNEPERIECASYLECDGVAQQRLIGIVRQEHPALGFGHSEQGGLFLQLDLVGLLGPFPGGVTSSPDLSVEDIGALVLPVGHSGVYLHGAGGVLLLGDGVRVVGGEEHGRDPGVSHFSGRAVYFFLHGGPASRRRFIRRRNVAVGYRNYVPGGVQVVCRHGFCIITRAAGHQQYACHCR